MLIATHSTLISAGTERMLVEFSRASWFGRARQQPDRVRQLFDKLRADGLLATVEAVRSKLDQPLALGYCNVGRVVAVGAEVSGFAVGERVVSNGPHAEFVAVPRNLCARVPDQVADEAAAFTVIGAVALQGIRLAGPTLGECFAVIGLGLIGLITVQLLRAHGCRVLGIDPDPARTALACSYGAEVVDVAGGEDTEAAAARFSRARGLDGVLVSAATASSEPVSQAARMCRKRGRIVLVGVTGLELNRADFYEKELSFQVSCSYGPGRYDPAYEEGGADYPYGLVRWTAQRNFEAVLDMLAAGSLDVAPLITHRFAFGEAPHAYEQLVGGGEPTLGIMLTYAPSEATVAARTVRLAEVQPRQAGGAAAAIGVIGAGNYAGRILVPAFVRAGAERVGIASSGGVSAAHLARKFGFGEATTDTAALIADPRVNAVVIATRHDSHGRFVREALSAGKHVFVEKPLAITLPELDEIESCWRALPGKCRPLLTVGFNRRFAPHVVRMKALLEQVRLPRSVLVTVNAGAVPGDHWTRDSAVGGGRIIGEGCHFIDLMRFLVGHPVTGWNVRATGAADRRAAGDVSATITLAFADGSVGTLHYLVSGHRAFPKERIEAFCAGRVLQLDNFRVLRGFGWRDFGTVRLWRQDKGQDECARAFCAAVANGGPAPIPFDELLEVSRLSVLVGEAARVQ
jgi:predicted dehydrogenase/threonine dehydrogenase-like Zn-dependent dehydrogenase